MQEIWKDIKGYEGKYMISDFGNVKALSQTIVYSNGHEYQKKGHTKKTTVNAQGYKVVSLWSHNVGKVFLVHRLVAETFIENPQNKRQVNHLDGDKTNNHISNLEWATVSENIDHAYEHKLTTRARPVRCVETGIVYRSVCNASEKMFGSRKKQASISACAHGQIKSHLGYHWEFVQEGQ